MFWADKIAEEIQERLKEKITSRKPLLIRDEKTASGRVHVGSMRGVAIHALVADVLKEKGIPAEFRYEINDFDPMDGLPVYLDAAQYAPEMGKPLNHVPSPDTSAPSFAEYFAQEFTAVIQETGYNPTYYRSSELYKSGAMNAVIETALNRAADIRRIYKEVSGAERADDWYPLSVICENCGRVGTTRVRNWDGGMVTYTCEEEMVEWAQGCGHAGTISPFDGRAKLPWKVEWPAKWKVLGVDIEGAGKDHATKGGARDVANHISREVFAYEPPFDIPYEHFLDKEGKKMSSSKGRGASAREIADLLPPVLYRLLLEGTIPGRAIKLDPEGETLPTLYDWHDKIAEKYWDGIGDDDARLFELLYQGKAPVRHFLPRFSTVAFLVQIPYVNLQEEMEGLKGGVLTEQELRALEERSVYARKWLGDYAPERYRFEIQTEQVPESALLLNDLQKQALRETVAYMEAHPEATGENLHEALHGIKEQLGIAPRDFFSAIYASILGKESGPQAGWFLSVIDRSFVIDRLKAVSA